MDTQTIISSDDNPCHEKQQYTGLLSRELFIESPRLLPAQSFPAIQELFGILYVLNVRPIYQYVYLLVYRRLACLLKGILLFVNHSQFEATFLMFNIYGFLSYSCNI